MALGRIIRLIYVATNRFEAKVDSIVKNKTWVWKFERSVDLVNIQSQLSLVEFKDQDEAMWTATKSDSYSCAATCNEFRNKEDEVDWWRLLWFSLTLLPQTCFYQFMDWLAIKNQLTRER